MLGKDAEPAIPALAELLPTLSDERAMYALSAIANYGKDATAAVPAVVECYLEREGEASELAGRLLLLFGATSAAALDSRRTSASDRQLVRINTWLSQGQQGAPKDFDGLIKLNADAQLLLFHFAGQVIERQAPIGLRRVSAILSTMPEVERLELPTSEASLRAMFAALESGVGTPLTTQTTKGAMLTAAGSQLAGQSGGYLTWRGLLSSS